MLNNCVSACWSRRSQYQVLKFLGDSHPFATRHIDKHIVQVQIWYGVFGVL